MVDKEEEVLSTIRERFEALNLHDARLIGIRIGRRTDAPREVHMDLELVAGTMADKWSPAVLTFIDCALIRATVDFWAKRACSDSIAESTCEHDTERMAELLEQNYLRDQEQPSSQLLMFSILLCPPAGELLVIAKDFELAELPV